MFTGIIGSVGVVTQAGSGRIAVQSAEVAGQAATGGSVALNGACLTVVAVEGDVFRADVVPETLKRTNLGTLQPGSAVNLELPVKLDQPLDGHLVQGHVDAMAAIVGVSPAEIGSEVIIELPDSLAAYVAEKGSIAVDGASLTVAGIDDQAGTFTIALIPHTLENTIARSYRIGSLVNLEVDLVARYLERMVRRSTSGGI